MATKRDKHTHESTKTDLDEARIVKDRVMSALSDCDPKAVPKLIDSYARMSTAIRQLEKQRKKELGQFSDDEVIEYIKALPDRRREAVVTAVQGESLAGKPLL